LNGAKHWSSEEALADQLVWVDHREEEESIVTAIASTIGMSEHLFAAWKDEDLWVSYKGKEFRLPLTISMHDRYVAISSLAVVLEKDYEFWIQEVSLDCDTHGLRVLERGRVERLAENEKREFLERFVPLELGQDYFSGLKIPYLGKPDNNPSFESESKKYEEETKLLIDSTLQSPEFLAALETTRAELRNVVASNGRSRSFARTAVRWALYFVVGFLLLRVVRYLSST
jgi:hypothetical protein